MTSSAPTIVDPIVPAVVAPAVPAVSNLRVREALASVRDELARMPDRALLVINLDIPAAVMTVRGCIPEIVPYRDRIATLPSFDVTVVDKLETYALAAWQANAQFVAASRPPEPIQPLAETLTELRALLFSDATALARRSLIDGAPLKALKGPIGFKNLADDVIILAAIFRDAWPTLQGNTAVKLPELDHAEQLADRLAMLVGFREQGPSKDSEVGMLRQRSFSLFVTAYDQVRRALSFLRWDDGDLDSIAPSLYAKDRKKRQEATVEPEVPVAPTVPNAPAPVTPGGTAPTSTNGAPIPAGMAGSDPFGRV